MYIKWLNTTKEFDFDFVFIFGIIIIFLNPAHSVLVC